MTGIWETDRQLIVRKLFGRGYDNRDLESKRRSAILWLRYCSGRGWAWDN
jgi:hypothetical protein